ncbi:hypothetical protein FJT64_022969 [Amphibalanus amphitrite]|uniref:Uncharacterized protein n=1 Tax=Amphibalanus amphitrite TaxID=1232801 RepID=A0A6A4WFD1_AMPAM|nr:hypothetical protein FJT64_022969 [Amphibalanus amphitrite]
MRFSCHRPEESVPLKATSRVRVTYYESKRPLSVSGSSSESSEVCSERPASRRTAPAPAPAAAPAAVTTTVSEMPTTYVVSSAVVRSEVGWFGRSVDAGWENPFRPGGELSKEADQIVRAIQSGRPLNASTDLTDGPPAANGGPPSPAAGGGDAAPTGNGHLSPSATNGAPPPVKESAVTARAAAPVSAEPPPPGATVLAAQPAGAVEVHHSVVASPEGAGQVERVALKKKPRGRCCVVQ